MKGSDVLTLVTVSFVGFCGVASEAKAEVCGTKTCREENLCPIRTPPSVSWVEHDWGYKVRDGVALIESVKEQGTCYPFRSPWFPAFVASDRLRISFECRGKTPNASLIYYPGLMERFPDAAKVSYEIAFSPSEEWKSFEFVRPFPDSDAWYQTFGIHIPKGDNRLEIRNLRIEEVPPPLPQGKPFVINGRRASEIVILDSDSERRHGKELRAARMFRYMLRKAGGDYLPVRTVDNLSDVGENAVLVGAAAEKAGFFPRSTLARLHTGLTGGGACSVKDARLGLTGALMGGLRHAVFAFFRSMGVEYLGSNAWRIPGDGSFEVTGGLSEVWMPAVPAYNEFGSSRMGQMPELRGYGPFEEDEAEFSVGAAVGNVGPDHSMAQTMVTVDEFYDSHPEFFAVDGEGKRMPRNTDKWAVQYCMNAPGLAELVGNRMKEIMRATPLATFYMIAPGDGGNSFCRCEKCRSERMSDIWLKFANKVAAITSQEFPDRYIETYSYVDTLDAPISGERPHPNVICRYCIYESNYWPSCMVYRHPSNARGVQALSEWRKVFPNLGLSYYPMECGEWMNLWPSYRSDVEVIREFASQNAVAIRYFGMWPVHGTSLPQIGAFADLRIYVLRRLAEDPSYDADKGARAFIRDFYGPAAKRMQDYFDLVMAEPERIDWVQNCERHVRGFVQKDFAARCLPILDAAEKSAGSASVRERVLHEKIPFLWTYFYGVSRGAGNVSSEEFPAWADRVGEFCRICAETKIDYMCVDPAKWFYELAFLKIGKGEHWYNDPAIRRVMENPAKGLGGEIDNHATKTEKGIVIRADGMVGGEFFEPEAHRCVRRRSSGKGLLLTTLSLEEHPRGEVVLCLCGMDNDKDSVALARIMINGTPVLDGKVPFGKGKWNSAKVTIPAGVLKKGKNDIRIENITPDVEASGDREGGDRFQSPRDYYWGWFGIKALRFDGVK